MLFVLLLDPRSQVASLMRLQYDLRRGSLGIGGVGPNDFDVLSCR
jgi:hypothetical protein